MINLILLVRSLIHSFLMMSLSKSTNEWYFPFRYLSLCNWYILLTFCNIQNVKLFCSTLVSHGKSGSSVVSARCHGEPPGPAASTGQWQWQRGGNTTCTPSEVTPVLMIYKINLFHQRLDGAGIVIGVNTSVHINVTLTTDDPDSPC